MVILDEKSCDKGSYESYKIIQKISRAHERAVIGVAYVQDTDSQQEYLVTCAQESLKIWLVDANDPGLLIEKLEIKEWRSGVQDFDVTSDGKMIAVVGTDSTIHIYKLSFSDYSHTSETFYEGFMQQWFVKIAPKATHLVTVNFSGLIMVVSTSGKVQGSFNFNEARQISSLTYSPDGQSIAIATNEGIVTIVSVATLETRFYFEGSHAIKVRAVCFSPTSDHLLTGSDDKIVKLHMISANKAQLVRSFCGHRSCVTMVKYHSQDPKMYIYCYLEIIILFASSSNDGCVIVWSTTQHHPLHIFQGDHEGVVSFTIN
ncbi:unnamed protein product [Thelazia callipaeda]|uniref:WD_REPEATS_REGION domain-containing protein n=1 Tax=Thelazia callipaeda TaxID=103827 RepID=A0A0N5CMY6_THECL|nr:unnamed protein product [Thelazia callipaeda]